MFSSKIAKSVFVFISLMMFAAVDGNAKTAKEFDWNPVMDAITIVESGGNPKAVSKDCCGAMQIRPICVKECNLILKARGEKKRYTMKDRFNVQKSREMFVLIMSKYNAQNDVERAIRLWNGGIRYKIKSTQGYYNKVMSHMKKK